MQDRSARAFAAAATLIVVWNAVYWWYEPGPPPVTFAPAETEPPEPHPIPVERPVAPEGVEVVPPRFISHTVRADETMRDVARRYLGDAEKWSAVARANPLVDPARLRAGETVLRVPVDPKNIQGLAAGLDGSRVAAEPPGPPAPTDRQYVTRQDDTLSGIAKLVYGKASLWPVIFEANRGTLKSPDRVPEGVTLNIPAHPTESPPAAARAGGSGDR